MTRLWILAAALLAQNFDLALDEGIRRYWNGEYEATVNVLETACAMTESSGERLECHKYLAFSHIALGADDEAREQFTRLLSADPGYRLDETLASPKILVRFDTARKALANSIYDNGNSRIEVKTSGKRSSSSIGRSGSILRTSSHGTTASSAKNGCA